jgi:hypothetical protein
MLGAKGKGSMRNLKVAGAILLALGLGGTAWQGCTPRSPEPPVVEDLRAFHAAEAAYARHNGGFFDEPPCLVKPSTCVPNFAAGTTFLDPQLASMDPRHGYIRSFHSGPAAPPEEVAKGEISPTSLVTFAYVAVSPTPGQPSYCVDSTGRVCTRRDGKMQRPESICPRECESL